MGKSQTLIVQAKHLTPYNLTQIRRRSIIKTAIERLEILEKKLKDKLKPVLDAEIGGEKILAVEVKGTMVRLNKVKKNIPQYKNICDELADETMLKVLMETVDGNGDPMYISEQSYVSAKILGRASTAASILTP